MALSFRTGSIRTFSGVLLHPVGLPGWPGAVISFRAARIMPRTGSALHSRSFRTRRRRVKVRSFLILRLKDAERFHGRPCFCGSKASYKPGPVLGFKPTSGIGTALSGPHSRVSEVTPESKRQKRSRVAKRLKLQARRAPNPDTQPAADKYRQPRQSSSSTESPLSAFTMVAAGVDGFLGGV